MYVQNVNKRRGLAPFQVLSAVFLASLLFSCAYPLSNGSYAVTVVNPEPDLGKVFLTDSEATHEVGEVLSKAYFCAQELSLSYQLKSGQRGLFLGWESSYPLSVFLNGPSERIDYHMGGVHSFTISDTTWLLKPRFSYVANTKPLWVDAERIVFHSNRDGGSGLWIISPSGGKARALTPSYSQAEGAQLEQHRFDAFCVDYAWQGSPYVILTNSSSLSPREEELWHIDTGFVSSLATDFYGRPAQKREFLFCDLAGNIVLAAPLSSCETGSVTTNFAVGIIRPSGGQMLLETPQAQRLEAGCGGQQGSLFRALSTDSGSVPLLKDICVVDIQAGTISRASGLAINGDKGSFIPYHPIALSGDGSRLALGVDWRDALGKLLGAAIIIMDGDAGYRKLPLSGDFMAIDSSSLRLSHDGSRFSARDLQGSLGAYSSIDGSFIESLETLPEGSGIPWRIAILDAYTSVYAFRPAASPQAPEGTARVVESPYGKNTDLRLEDGETTVWLTGPESEDL